ncbi:MAG TPA: hypothetical protein VHG89_02275 [Verrucomicrobiae bacterium]|nr:hypothetical protein [Verrucomicrobiae bacterium]
MAEFVCQSQKVIVGFGQFTNVRDMIKQSKIAESDADVCLGPYSGGLRESDFTTLDSNGTPVSIFTKVQ